MIHHETLTSARQLPFAFDEARWGTVQWAKIELPGIFSVVTNPLPGNVVGAELYVVTEQATPSIISPEVIVHGSKENGIWVFEMVDATSVYHLVEHEIMRYRVLHDLPLERTQSVYNNSVYLAHTFPWYFSGVLPPRKTPYGLTLRAKEVSTGIFFLETERFQWCLALSAPVWECDLSYTVKMLGVFGDDQLSLREEAAKYLFFPLSQCAPALYELARYEDYSGVLSCIRSEAVLETYLCERFPEYVEWHNTRTYNGKRITHEQISHDAALSGQGFFSESFTALFRL